MVTDVAVPIFSGLRLWRDARNPLSLSLQALQVASYLRDRRNLFMEADALNAIMLNKAGASPAQLAAQLSSIATGMRETVAANERKVEQLLRGVSLLPRGTVHEEAKKRAALDEATVRTSVLRGCMTRGAGGHSLPGIGRGAPSTGGLRGNGTAEHRTGQHCDGIVYCDKE